MLTATPAPFRHPTNAVAVNPLVEPCAYDSGAVEADGPLDGPGIGGKLVMGPRKRELPTAKPRARSPLLRSEAPSPITSDVRGVRHFQLTADRPGLQGPLPGTT
jgi:hypothetical protein